MILETTVIAKHAWKVYNYKMATPRGSSAGTAAAGSCVASLSTALRVALRRVALSIRQLPGGSSVVETSDT